MSKGAPSLLLSTAIELMSGKSTSLQLMERAIKLASLDVNKNVILAAPGEHAAALKMAAGIDSRRNVGGAQLSLLAGVPISIKDNFNVEGAPATAGSSMLSDYVSAFDSTIVTKLRAADAIPCLRANMDEFGMGSSMLNSAYGPCANPWTPPGSAKLTPGGSSGGSACAVASGIAFAAIGSDTGGSVRLPASFCGVVGFKPTYGTISRHGLIAYASSMDTPGILAQSVFDAALLYDVVGGYDANDSNSVGGSSLQSTLSTSSSSSVLTCASSLLKYCDSNSAPLALHNSQGAARALKSLSGNCSLKGVVVGVVDEFILAELSPDTTKAWEGAVQMLVDAGATVKSVSVPALKLALPAYYVLACAEASSNLSRYDGIRYGARSCSGRSDFLSEVAATRGLSFGPEVVKRLLTGTYVLTSDATETYYLKALEARAALRRQFEDCFSGQGVTVCVCPTSPSPPYPLQSPPGSADLLLNDVFTVPANLASLPCVSVPVATGRVQDTGALYPIGMQVMAAPLAEIDVLRAARAMEQRADFHNLLPSHLCSV